MISKKKDASACILNNKFIYVIGGFHITELNDIERYNISNNTWTAVQFSKNTFTAKLSARNQPFCSQISPFSILISGG